MPGFTITADSGLLDIIDFITRMERRRSKPLLYIHKRYAVMLLPYEYYAVIARCGREAPVPIYFFTHRLARHGLRPPIRVTPGVRSVVLEGRDRSVTVDKPSKARIDIDYVDRVYNRLETAKWYIMEEPPVPSELEETILGFIWFRRGVARIYALEYDAVSEYRVPLSRDPSLRLRGYRDLDAWVMTMTDLFSRAVKTIPRFTGSPRFEFTLLHDPELPIRGPGGRLYATYLVFRIPLRARRLPYFYLAMSGFTPNKLAEAVLEHHLRVSGRR